MSRRREPSGAGRFPVRLGSPDLPHSVNASIKTYRTYRINRDASNGKEQRMQTLKTPAVVGQRQAFTLMSCWW